MAKGFNGLIEMVVDESKNQWDDDFNNGPDSDFYKLAASFMPALVYLEDKAISLKRGMNLYTCQNQELDDILNNDVFPRILGNKSSGVFEITGSNSIYCAVGSIQVEAYNGLTYTNTSDGTVLNGVVDLDFKSDLVSSKANIPANNIQRVVKAPSGVTDVQNKNPTVDGLDVETDYEYLNRFQQANTAETWVLASIVANVKKVPGVTSANGNRNNTMQTVDGLKPKSIRIVVKGGLTQDICEAIYNKIHTPETVGLVSGSVEIFPGKTETIRFDRPTEVKIDYQYNIMADKKTEVLNLLKEYLNELDVGAFVSQEDFRNKKIGCSLDYGIKGMAVRFKKQGVGSFEDFLQLSFDEEGTEGTGAEV